MMMIQVGEESNANRVWRGAWDTPSEHAKPWKHHAGPRSGQENPWGAISKQIEASAARKERDI